MQHGFGEAVGRGIRVPRPEFTDVQVATLSTALSSRVQPQFVFPGNTGMANDIVAGLTAGMPQNLVRPIVTGVLAGLQDRGSGNRRGGDSFGDGDGRGFPAQSATPLPLLHPAGCRPIITPLSPDTYLTSSLAHLKSLSQTPASPPQSRQYFLPNFST